MADLLTRYPIIGADQDPEETDAAQAMTEPDGAYMYAAKRIDIETWFIEIPGKSEESAIAAPDLTTPEATAAMSRNGASRGDTAIVSQEEATTLPQPESAILQDPFELTAGPRPLPRFRRHAKIRASPWTRTARPRRISAGRLGIPSER